MNLYVLGAPLSDSDLTHDDELAARIQKWLLDRAMGVSSESVSKNSGPSVSQSSSTGASANTAIGKRDNNNGATDDLYDF